jgi:hypothetical protein
LPKALNNAAYLLYLLGRKISPSHSFGAPPKEGGRWLSGSQTAKQEWR